MFYRQDMTSFDEYFSAFDSILAGTGSRELTLKDEVYKNDILSKLCDEVINYDLVLSGAAEGFDAAVAIAAHLKHVPYVLCVPNKGYPHYYWALNSLTGTDRYWGYEFLEKHAEHVIFIKEDVFNINNNGVYYNQESNSVSWSSNQGEHFNFIRNAFMVRYASKFVAYDSSSRGTSHCIGLIEEADIPYIDLKE